MRTAAKILNIISMVLYGLIAILLLWVGCFGGTVVNGGAGNDYISGLTTGIALVFEFVYLVAGFFVAYVSIKKINDENAKKKDFILWGILNIFFVGTISGVLTLLCMLDANE